MNENEGGRRSVNIHSKMINYAKSLLKEEDVLGSKVAIDSAMRQLREGKDQEGTEGMLGVSPTEEMMRREKVGEVEELLSRWKELKAIKTGRKSISCLPFNEKTNLKPPA